MVVCLGYSGHGGLRLEGTTVELGPFGVQLFSVHIDPFPVVVVVFRISF
jgi:hypothetical protein